MTGTRTCGMLLGTDIAHGKIPDQLGMILDTDVKNAYLCSNAET